MTTQVQDLPNFATDDIPNVKLYGVLPGTPNSQGLVPVSALGEVEGVGGGGSSQEGALNWTGDASIYLPAYAAMQIAQGNAKIGTGTITFAKSTNAAPATFATTSLPATLEAGAWLRVTAAGVSGFCATHLRRV